MATKKEKPAVGTEIETRVYRITFTERLLGGCPKSQTLYSDYVASNAPSKEKGEEEVEMIENDKKGITGFHSDDEGIYLVDYQFKGFLKNSGNTLRDILKIAALRSKVENFLFIAPRYIWLKEKPDGVFERPLRASTPQGVRVSLAASEYCDPGLTVDIKLVLYPHHELTWGIVEKLLDYGQHMGVGQFRSGSYGRFTWKRVEPAQKKAA